MKDIQRVKKFILNAQNSRAPHETITADYLTVLAFIIRGASTREALRVVLGNLGIQDNDKTLEQLKADGYVTVKDRRIGNTNRYECVYKYTEKALDCGFSNDSQFIYEIMEIKKTFQAQSVKFMLNYLYFYLLIRERDEITSQQAEAEYGRSMTSHDIYNVFKRLGIVNLQLLKDKKTTAFWFKHRWIQRLNKTAGRMF